MSTIEISAVEILALKKLALINMALAQRLEGASTKREQLALLSVLNDVILRADTAKTTGAQP